MCTPQTLRRALSLLGLAGSLLPMAAWAAGAPAGPAPARQNEAPLATDALSVTDRLIVKYRGVTAAGRELPNVRAESAAREAAKRQGVAMRPLRRMATGAHVLQFDRPLTHAAARRIAAELAAGDATIEYAEPDRVLYALASTNDPMLAQQWALNDATGGIRAGAAWDKATGSGVVVAVVDSGVRPHADLQPNLLPGYDFITDVRYANDGGARDADAYDPGDAVSAGFCGPGAAAEASSWHGTHVAGIVAAAGNNGAGVAGVAYGAKVLPLRALGRCGGYTSDIADAITWAAGDSVSGVPANTNAARVINLSLGGTGPCDRTSQTAIDGARARGAVVVVAAGNESSNVSTSSPANCSGVIAVAATGRNGGRASYSNYGAGVTLAAPGGDSGDGILSTLNAGTGAPGADNYASYAGTSMAAPAVSGVVALMLQVNPKLTPDQVGTVLTATVRSFPATCSGCGAGLLDAAAAVTQAATTPAAPTTPVTPVTPVTPTPTPTVTAVTEKENNSTLAKAQAVASLPSLVTGSVGATSDLDYYKVSVPAGRTLSASLTMGSKSAFTLAIYTAAGKLVSSMGGSAGLQRALQVRNVGTAATTMVVRVNRASGSTGSYQLKMST